jgi:hypothetical protein
MVAVRNDFIALLFFSFCVVPSSACSSTGLASAADVRSPGSASEPSLAATHASVKLNCYHVTLRAFLLVWRWLRGGATCVSLAAGLQPDLYRRYPLIFLDTASFPQYVA